MGDLATAFTSQPVLRAEARLALAPELGCSGPSTGASAWEAASLDLAHRCGTLPPNGDFGAERLVRALATLLAGHRYTPEVTSGLDAMGIEERYRESFETVVSAMEAFREAAFREVDVRLVTDR